LVHFFARAKKELAAGQSPANHGLRNAACSDPGVLLEY